MEQRKTLNHKRLNNQFGYSIIELLMVLTIAAILLGGTFVFVNKALSGNKVKTEKQNIAVIRMSIQELYSAQNSYLGLTNTVAENSGAFPISMIKGAGIYNSWGGTVSVAPGAGATPNTFTVTYSTIPKEEALKLSIFDVGQWASVTLNGTAIPQTSAGALGAASGSVLDANNVIVFESI